MTLFRNPHLRRTQARPKQTGLTLIELMIALIIGAIVITMATPISNLVKRNQTTTNVHEFVTTLNYARSEAITRGNDIIICRTDPNNTNACANVPDPATNIPWEQGWIVFTDPDGDDAINDVNTEILRRHDPLSAGYTLRVTGVNEITYNGIGVARDAAATWSLCDKTQDNQFKRGIQLILSGKVNLVAEADIPALPCSPA